MIVMDVSGLNILFLNWIFGRDYVKGLIQDKDGNGIMLRNAEDLYDLLVKNLEVSAQHKQ